MRYLIMSVNFYRKIKILNDQWDRKLKEFILKNSSKKVLIILFGSRARNKHHLLSDYDILIISNEDDLHPDVEFPCDIFVYTYKEAESQLKQGNTILLDAFLEGKFLVNNLKKTNSLKQQAQKIIDKKNLVKDRRGWLVNSIVE
ncbi:MAG: hypothetical protein GF308_06605 [Candidatus Heimdallarchaeota archaeon]|nr:hypothetical protein [Candidatus Heimdallarchaeota archaeon]